MKRLLTSVLTLGLVIAAVVTASNAFFSDTETSTNNVFQSGEIDLTIASECTYNGASSDQCGTWDATNLTSEKFFNFIDLKPGDYGENTVTLELTSNPAYACAIIQNMHDDDLGLTEPEIEDGDTTIGADNGELADELRFFAWDDDGDNIWESGEQTLFSNVEGPASDVLGGVSYNLGVMQPGTNSLGIYWCYGELTVDENNNTLSCNGAASTNISQSDALTADLKFYVEQERNNDDFSCPAPENTAREFVIDEQSLGLQNWFGYNDETDVIDNSLVFFQAGPSTPPAGTNSLGMTVSGTQRRNIATYMFSGLSLDDITELKFNTYQASGQPGTERAVYMHFNVDFDGSDTWQRRLVYVPRQNGTVQTDTWQEWDALDSGSALWWWSGYASNGNEWPDGSTDEYRTWNDILTTNPGIRVRVTDSWLGFRAGEPYNDGFTGFFDKFVIGVNGNTSTYDFE